MIDLKQMVGTNKYGERQVFDVDTVYLVEGDSRKKVGYINRKPNAKFVPVGRMTDDERDQLVKDVDEARESQGRFGPSSGCGPQRPSDEAVAEAVAELEEDGDDV